MLSWFKKPPPQPPRNGPDFSGVDSLEKAQALTQDGTLRKILLLPAQFGGADIPTNVIYIPPLAADHKDDIDTNIIRPLIRDGAVKSYVVTPAYNGRSFIPVSLTVIASDPKEFTATIGIWGVGLEGNA